MQEACFLITRQTDVGFSRTALQWGRGEDSKSRTLRHLAQAEDRQSPVAVEVAYFKPGILNVPQTSARLRSVDRIWRNASEPAVRAPLRVPENVSRKITFKSSDRPVEEQPVRVLLLECPPEPVDPGQVRIAYSCVAATDLAPAEISFELLRRERRAPVGAQPSWLSMPVESNLREAQQRSMGLFCPLD